MTESVTQKIVIVDIDHTISDAAWRDHLLGQWNVYYDEGLKDEPIRFAAELIQMIHLCGREIVACTARPENARNVTVKWMVLKHIPIDMILMRGEDDHRPSAEVKRDLIVTNFPDLSVIDFVLEDNDACVAAYRQLGLNVLQIYPGGGVTHGQDTGEVETPPHRRREPQEPGHHPRGAEDHLRTRLLERGPIPGRDVP
jgi:5'(3')-deoxyribonucleotidase